MEEDLDDLIILSIPNENLMSLDNGSYEIQSTSEEIEVEQDMLDDALLKKLLKEFEMESVYEYLKGSHVTFKSLRYMEKEDVKEAIPPLGLRMEFREKLFAWKKKEFGIDDETLSMTSKVCDWLKHSNATFPAPASSVKFGISGKLLDKGLVSLLNESLSGNDILEYYGLYKSLTNEKRFDPHHS